MIPLPVDIQYMEGKFHLDLNTCIYSTTNLQKIVAYFQELIKDSTGYELNIVDGIKHSNSINFILDDTIKNLKEGEITKKDIIKLKNNGMVIGSHSMTHCFLNTLSKKDVFYELNESKKILEDIIQDEIRYFSIPRGLYTKEVIETAKRAGYKNLFTSEIGINYNQDFLLKRIPIKRNTKLSDFKDILNGKNVERMAFNQKLKDKAKVLLGIDNYNRLRKALVPRVE